MKSFSRNGSVISSFLKIAALAFVLIPLPIQGEPDRPQYPENSLQGTGWKNPVPRFTFRQGARYLILEFLEEGLTRFEVSEIAKPPALDEPFQTSPMMARTQFPGVKVTRNQQRFETQTQVISVNPENLCLTLEDKAAGRGLTTLCADHLTQEYKTLSIDPYLTKHIYGLGQYPTNPGNADGDWVGRIWEPGPMGNTTRFLANGVPSFAQFPIFYALDSDGFNYALFLDVTYKQRWDFSRRNEWWKVDLWGSEIRGYLFSGKDLPKLRSHFMDIVGRPPVPPQKVFGFWMSEFGYDHWNEIDAVIRDLKSHQFPLEGVALDIEWYGNTFGKPETSRMGSLTFDEKRFPKADQKIQELKAEGIELMPIEQSYLHSALPEHQRMAERGFLAKDKPNGPPTFIDKNPWWGKGGLIDWTNPQAGAFWHDEKRMPLIQKGIHFHWTDLGEPEMYNDWAIYHGIAPQRHRHGDIHNVFNLMWLKSIDDGYQRNQVSHRHYTMSRSGTVGMQRFGAGMWSGDVAATMGYLAMHANTHMHMSFSGVDYYSSDTGGFFRHTLEGDLDELYTQWFAMACLINSPIRPHVWNQDNLLKNSPTTTGHLESNYENLMLRYELMPYYYTLAHRAYHLGEPLFPPLVFYYQNDPNVRQMGNQMMIGRALMGGIVAKYGETDRNVYLPKGRWFDYHSHQSFVSQGEFLKSVPVYREGKFKLPLFAKAGAIIPKAKIASAKNALNELVVRVYSDPEASQFELIEDDGVSLDYQKGRFRKTLFTQEQNSDRAKVTIHPSEGGFGGAPSQRQLTIEWVTQSSSALGVTLNGKSLPEAKSRDAFENQEGPVFWNAEKNRFLVKSPNVATNEKLVFESVLKEEALSGAIYFVCRNGQTNPGESIYVVGNLPQLGNWNPAQALKLAPLPYPAWTGNLFGIVPDTLVEWKCLKRKENSSRVLQWEAGENHQTRLKDTRPIVVSGGL